MSERTNPRRSKAVFEKKRDAMYGERALKKANPGSAIRKIRAQAKKGQE